MELELKKERETPLLSRRRLTLSMEYKGATPSRAEIRDKVAEKFKGSKDLTIIKHIYTRYGTGQARVIAHLYGKKEDLEKIEDSKMLKKHEPKEKKEKK